MNFFSAQQLTAAAITAAKTLRFAFYNTATGAWEVVSGANVDVNAQVVTQTTTHFSQWGVFSDTQQNTDGSQGTSSALGSDGKNCTIAPLTCSAQGIIARSSCCCHV